MILWASGRSPLDLAPQRVAVFQLNDLAEVNLLEQAPFAASKNATAVRLLFMQQDLCSSARCAMLEKARTETEHGPSGF